jgi:hypothetical protein
MQTQYPSSRQLGRHRPVWVAKAKRINRCICILYLNMGTQTFPGWKIMDDDILFGSLHVQDVWQIYAILHRTIGTFSSFAFRTGPSSLRCPMVTNGVVH